MNTMRQGLALLLLGVTTAGSAQPETAPPPREKLTPNELIVGRWRLVKFDEKPVLAMSTETIVFTAKETFVLRTSHTSHPDRIVSGTYRVVGKVLVLSAEPPQPVVTEQFPIIEISKSRLFIQLGKEVNFKRSEYVRDEGVK